MMTTLKRVAAAIAAIASYGTYAYDSADGKPKFTDENGLLMALNSDGLRDQNLAINGSYDYAQRQAPGTLTTYSQTASRQYAADRWGITNENASVQFRRVDTSGAVQTGMFSRFYGEYSKITTTGKIVVSQPIEAGNCLHLRGRTVRFQAKLRCSGAKTIRMLLMQLTAAGTIDTVPGYAAGAPSGTFVSAFGANGTDPTFGTNLSKIAPVAVDNATSANTGLSCSVTTTFQRFGGTFTLPTDFKNLVMVFVTDSQFVATDRLEITEVGLYDGVEVREWAERMQQTQYINCARYYQKTFNVDTAPAQSAGTGIGELRWPSPVTLSTATTLVLMWRLAVPMRVAPTITRYNPSAANAEFRNLTDAADCSASANSAGGETTVYFGTTTSAGTAVGEILSVHAAADAEF